LLLVIIAVINTAIAIYYYLRIVRETCTRDAGDQPAIVLDWPTRAVCVLLIGAITVLGIFPSAIIDVLSRSLAYINLPLS
jgi:NADH-quinone oxidoreductase subunit N